MASTPSGVMSSEVSPGPSGTETPTAAAVTPPPPPPKKKVRMPVTLTDAISAGKTLRMKKMSMAKKSGRKSPKPKFPRGMVATERDVKMSRRQMRRQARCLAKHNIVLSDRMDELSKPTRRQLIALWRTYAEILSPEQINNLQNLLDASDPFKPDQAYEYFVNLKKQKKKAREKEAGGKDKKKELSALCGDRRFAWVRSATVAFARGIQRRLGRPGNFDLEGGMLRLSEIVLDDICYYTKSKKPSRRSSMPKAKFMCDMADKIAVWIDEILAESDERLLMMDYDEDDEVKHADEPYIDDFLSMMAGKGAGARLMPRKPAYTMFKGEMLDAFKLLTDSMYKKGDEILVKHGLFKMSYKEGADELRATDDLTGVDYDPVVADGIAKKLDNITKTAAVGKLEQPMKDIIDICSKYLARTAEYSKDKGDAFKYLIQKMREQSGDPLYAKGKMTKTMGQGADDLVKAKGLVTDHDNPQATQEIFKGLQRVTKGHPEELRDEMPDTLEKCAKYLSQKFSDDSERGAAFEKMLEILMKHGGAPLCPDSPIYKTAYDAAQSLMNAPGLKSVKPDPEKSLIYQQALQGIVGPETPREMMAEMSDAIKYAADYLSGTDRDRRAAQEILLKMMKDRGTKEAAMRNNVAMTFGQGAQTLGEGPIYTPLAPVGAIQKEIRDKLDNEVNGLTPLELKGAMKALVRDVGGDLSQDVALQSGVAGERYPRNLIAAAADSKGDELLFKNGAYGMTYSEAANALRNAGTMEKSDDPRAVALSDGLKQKMGDILKEKVAGETAKKLDPHVLSAAQHLAKAGLEGNEALSYLLGLMDKKRDEQLAKLHGRDHTYGDAIGKINRAQTLQNDNVDKGLYETVRSKLKDLMKQYPPPPELAAKMSTMIDDVAKFLAQAGPDKDGGGAGGGAGGYYGTGGPGGGGAGGGYGGGMGPGGTGPGGTGPGGIGPGGTGPGGTGPGETGPGGTGPGGMGPGGTGPGGTGPGGLVAGGTGPGGWGAGGTGSGGTGPGGTGPGGTGPGGWGAGGTGPGGWGAGGTGPGGTGPGGTGPGGWGAGGTGPGGLGAGGTGPGGWGAGGSGPGGTGPGGTGPGGWGSGGTGPGGTGPGGTGPGEWGAGGTGPGGSGPGGWGAGGTGPGGLGAGGTGPGGWGAGGIGPGGTGPGGLGASGTGPGGTGPGGWGAGGTGPGGTGPGGWGAGGTGPGGWRAGGTGPGGTGPGGTGPGGTGPGGWGAGGTGAGGTGPGGTGPGGWGAGATGPGGLGAGGTGPGGTGPGGTGPGGWGAGGTGPGGTGPGGWGAGGTGPSGAGPGGTGPGGTGPGGWGAGGTGPGGTGPGGWGAGGTGPGGTGPGGTGPGGTGPGGTGPGGWGAGGTGPGGTGPGGWGTGGTGPSGTGPGGTGPGGTGPGGWSALGTAPGGTGPGGTGPGGTGPGGTGPGGWGAGGTGPGGLGAGGTGPGGLGASGTGPGGLGAGGTVPGGLGAAGTGPGGLGAGGTGPGGTGPGGWGAGTGPGGRGAGGTGPGGWGGDGTGPGGTGPGGTGPGGVGGLGAAGGLYGPGGASETPEARRARRLAALQAGERTAEQDREHGDAKKILIGEMKKKGVEYMYKQGPVSLTYGEGADIIGSTQRQDDVGRNIRDSPDTDKLAMKFEKKLGELVEGKTPPKLQDAMTDAIIESARPLAEHIIDRAYKAAVNEALIAAMQKKDNAVLVDQNGDAETFFYAAQRLKKAASLQAHEPKPKLSREIVKKLEDSVKCRPLPRKMAGSMKDHIKRAGDYLSERVTIPDPEIDAFIDLLFEMESAGNTPLVEGKIPKTHKEAAAYLKTVTTFEDRIGKDDSKVRGQIENGMKKLMEKVPLIGYTSEIRTKVIQQQARLLTSYLELNGEKIDAFEAILDALHKDPEAMILRHGSVRKSFFDAAQALHGKNPDELQNVRHVDPIVARKLQIRLKTVMEQVINKPFMSEVIEDVTAYLAVHLLHPHVMKVCKCMKSVFIQCELWNEEILRRVNRPCCTCSQGMVAERPSSLAPEVHIEIKECPAMATMTRDGTCDVCPAGSPSESIKTYALLQTETHFESASLSPTRLPPEPVCPSTPGKQLAADFTMMGQNISYSNRETLDRFSPSDSTPSTSYFTAESPQSRSPPRSQSQSRSSHTSLTRFHESPWNLFAQTQSRHQARSPVKAPKRDRSLSPLGREVNDAPVVVTTDQMSDMYAMMISLMWNMQAWRSWLQQILDHALNTQAAGDLPPEQGFAEWLTFQKKVMKEALQWRQYIKFSRQLTLRLEHRYQNKKIVSPTRASNKTESYKDCQQEMLEMTDMFSKWTQWLVAVLKESKMVVPQPHEDVPLHIVCWNHFKEKVQSSLHDWLRYKSHLNTCWEHKYRTIMSAWEQEDAVWVMSAYGAVPSGAVAAGRHGDEVIWVARTTHKSVVLPGALLPSEHCCLVYADGAVHCYPKYQVLCNADVQWVVWRASARCDAGARAVCVAPGVYVGRVEYLTHHLVGAVLAPNYRCHVVIHNRPFTFDCFELLIVMSK